MIDVLFPIEELSKKDFESLGCEDVPAKKLRARVFNLEGIASELALALADMIIQFAPTNDGLSDSEMSCANRAKEALLLSHKMLSMLSGYYGTIEPI